MYTPVTVTNRSFLPQGINAQLGLCRQVLKIILGLLLALLMVLAIVFLFSLFPVIRDMKHGYKHVKSGSKRAVAAGRAQGHIAHSKLSAAKLQGRQTLADARLYLNDAAPHIQGAASDYKVSAIQALGKAKTKSKVGLAKASREAMPILASIAANTAPSSVDQQFLANGFSGHATSGGLANLAANFGLEAAQAVNLKAQGKSAASVVSRMKDEVRGAVGTATQGALSGLQVPLAQNGLRTSQKLRKQFKNVAAGASLGAAYGASNPVSAGYSSVASQNAYVAPAYIAPVSLPTASVAFAAPTASVSYSNGPSAIPGLAALVANAGLRGLNEAV